MGKLTAIGIKSAGTGKHSDGEGLYLLVTPAGGRLWRMDYRHLNKRKTLALGAFPAVSLQQARERTLEARKLLADGIDPSEQKKAAKAASIAASQATFRVVAELWLAQAKADRKDATVRKVTGWLERDIYPVIGDVTVSKLTVSAVMTVLRKLEARGLSESIGRIKNVIGGVMRRAVQDGLADADPTASIRISESFKQTKRQHHAAIVEPVEFGGLLRAIDGYRGHFVVHQALKLTPLVALRPGELRQLEWSWVDLDQGVIELPASVMKMGLPHIVPLSRQAVEILRQLEPVSKGGKYVFPALRGRGGCISENTINACLRGMGYTNDVQVAHGFRASFRTLAQERLKIDPTVLELQLAHAPANPLGRSYDRTQMLPERAQAMQKWADYLDTLRHGGQVIPLVRGVAA